MSTATAVAAGAGPVRLRPRRPLGAVGGAGLALLALLAVAAVFAPWIAPYNPEETSGGPFEAPSRSHPLGTNDIGQDILSELVFGARISLVIGFLAALVAVGIGTAVGTVAGYFGGWLDVALMRVVDVVLVIPFLPLMILRAAYAGPAFWNIILVIGLLVWARPAPGGAGAGGVAALAGLRGRGAGGGRLRRPHPPAASPAGGTLALPGAVHPGGQQRHPD